MPAELAWTTETPTAPGKYAYRREFPVGGKMAYGYKIMLVHPDGRAQPSGGLGWQAINLFAKDLDGQWLGPLPE